MGTTDTILKDFELQTANCKLLVRRSASDSGDKMKKAPAFRWISIHPSRQPAFIRLRRAMQATFYIATKQASLRYHETD
jgi:hypothetical protein